MPKPQSSSWPWLEALSSLLRGRERHDDYLQVLASGTDASLRAFLREHPNEPHGLVRSGERLSVHLLLPRSQLRRLREHAKVEVLFNASEVGRLQQGQIAAGNQFILASKTTVAEQIMQRDKYLNVAEVESALATFAGDYPQLAKVRPLPHATAEGQTCHYVSIGSLQPQPKDVLVITGGVHGREWGSCEIALVLASRLLESYTSGADLVCGLGPTQSAAQVTYAGQRIRSLLETIDIVIFPQVNPDGRRYSQSGPATTEWQKNRNTAQAIADDPLSIGVDINRNFDFLFNLAAFDPAAAVSATSQAAGHDFYQGPAAFSEVESRNVKWLLDTHGRACWYVDLHSPGNQLLHVWSDDQMQSTDPEQHFGNTEYNGKRGLPGPGNYAEYIDANDLQEIQDLGAAFVNGVNALGAHTYVAKPAYDFYMTPIAGASHDYAYSRHRVQPSSRRVLAYVVEWGDTAHPDWIDMKSVIIEVTAGMVGFCLAAARV